MAAVSALEQLSQIESKSLSRKAMAVAGRQRAQEWRGVGFRVGDTELVASMDIVVEALEPVTCTRVPSAKLWFEGIANVRGQLVPISDLYAFLFGERQAGGGGRDARILVFKLTNSVAGLVVTAVTGVRNFPRDALEEKVGGLDPVFKPFVAGCFHRGGEDYPVFDFNRLVSNERFMHIMESNE